MTPTGFPTFRTGRSLALWFALLLAVCGAFGNQLRAAAPMPVRLTHDGYFKQRPAWSPDGKRLLFSRHRGGKIGLCVLEPDGSTETTLTSEKLPQYDACWSPDGAQIAFTHVPQSVGQGNLDVYIAAADGSKPKRFAGNRSKLSHEEYPAWSPDGRRIAFSSTFEGNQELYVAPVDGDDQRTRVTTDPALDAHPAWRPDSKKIAFATNRWGDFEIATVDADGTNPERLTENPGLDDYPAYSPDGRRIAFLSNRDQNYEIYVLNIDSRSVTNVTSHPALDTHPAWTPDGRLSFVSNRDDGFDIYVVEVP